MQCLAHRRHNYILNEWMSERAVVESGQEICSPGVDPAGRPASAFALATSDTCNSAHTSLPGQPLTVSKAGLMPLLLQEDLQAG